MRRLRVDDDDGPAAYSAGDVPDHGPLAPSRLLDRPSERVPLLDALFDRALLALALTAGGSTAIFDRSREASKAGAWKIKVTRQAAGTIAPTSSLASDIYFIIGRYTRARTHRQRLLAIKEAQEMAEKMRYGPNRVKVNGTQEWWDAIVADLDRGRRQQDIADDYGVSQPTISRIKRAAR